MTIESIDDATEDQAIFEYRSPEAVDPESNRVLLVVDWPNQPSYVQIHYPQNAFVMATDRRMITKSRVFTVQVFVGDDKWGPDKYQPVSMQLHIVNIHDQVGATTAVNKVNGSKSIATDSRPTSNNQSQSQPETQQQISTAPAVPEVDFAGIKGLDVRPPMVPEWKRKQPQQTVDSFWIGWKVLLNQNNTKPTTNSTEVLLGTQFKFDRNGNLTILFSHSIRVPNFKPKDDLETRRSLLDMSELDICRDLLDIQFDFFNKITPNNFTYSVDLVEWSPRQIVFTFNFSDPMIISQGDVLDKTYVRFKDTSIIQPAENGVRFNFEELLTEVVVIVPKQLPFHYNERAVNAGIQTAQKTPSAIMIMQVVAQIVLKGSLKLIIDLFLAIQMAVYVLLFNLKLPALAEMILQELKNLIEFRILNIEGVVRLWDEDFSLGKWMNGVKQKLVNEHQEQSFFAELIVYITLATVLALGFCAYLIVKRFGSKALKDKATSKME